MKTSKAFKSKSKRSKSFTRKNERSKSSEIKIGFPLNYEGPSPEACCSSAEALINDLAIQAGIPVESKDITTATQCVQKFITTFFVEAKKKKDGMEVKQFADACKARCNDLLSLVNIIATGDYYLLPETINFVTSNNGYRVTLKDLSYFPSRLKGILFYTPDCGLMDYFTITQEPRFYIYLYKAVFSICSLLGNREVRDDDAANQLFLTPVSFGRIFEKLNPTKEVMQLQADSTLEMLRQPSKAPSDKFWELFNTVKGDILNPRCNLRYVKDFQRSLRKFTAVSPFGDRDFYASLKASTSRIEMDGRFRKYPSFPASLFEYDILAGNPTVEAFDKLIQYPSDSYLTKQELEDLGYNVITFGTETIMIPNPNKFKGRCIHIGCNSIQDRCNWLHNHLQPFLINLHTDCMKRHQLGVDFLTSITKPESRHRLKNSIFVSDFSNATDTLNQEFQCACLAILFPEEVSNFWRIVSQLPKEFKMPVDDSHVHYIQETGQPQGYLGSFDAFSLAHHILMLMLMKASGNEHVNAEDFYRILGDDSIVSFPTEPDPDYATYHIHSWLCEEASLIKNDSKTGKSFYKLEQDEYEDNILDFAKISVSRGRFMSPLPVGLSTSYGINPAITSISAIIWYNSHRVTFNTMMHLVLWRCYGRSSNKMRTYEYVIALSIVFGGQIPYLQEFCDPELLAKIPLELVGLAHYLYGLCEIQRTFLAFFLSEGAKRDTLYNSYSFESIWKGFLPEDQMDLWSANVSSKHKYWRLLEKNMALGEDIQTLYDLGDPSLAQSVGCLVTRSGLETQITKVVELINFVRQLQKDDEESWMTFYDLQHEYYFSCASALEALQVKSFSKHSKDASSFLYSTVKLYRQEIATHLDYSREFSESYGDTLTYVFDSYLDLNPAGTTTEDPIF